MNFTDIVAYRSPYRWGSTVEFSPGGVATAGINMMKPGAGTNWWAVYDGPATGSRKQAIPHRIGHQRGIDLGRDEASDHYHWISNGILWPAMHSMPEYVHGLGFTPQRREHYDSA